LLLCFQEFSFHLTLFAQHEDVEVYSFELKIPYFFAFKITSNIGHLLGGAGIEPLYKQELQTFTGQV